ncbi:aliphatic sulfonate ABC transporter substrate-binding protein [Alkalinema sp. FACHB-956]|uniref:aliphatic sulfonate ABC transporter substrate-binding protein n=1 Tax=Alkalinema sp. FACHB-956 TaxID=2692768 RepID=UPI00168213DB|nr:aliphatic sulfonate ABC transporter substrate-binding protein [Alkalinema sp. FACHB-956]MBD2329241.1 aliphatic sulfonate ABC transporter substrate-binding protein [Alkalinema sp. FACHB-956]
MGSQFNISRRKFNHLIVPGAIGFSTVLASKGLAQGGAKNFKANVLRVGFQTSGDILKISRALEKKLEPLGVKVEWSQFAQGPQLMEALKIGRIDIGSVGETPPIFTQASGGPIVYIVGAKTTPETGRGSVIAVPPDSPIKSVRDIKGKDVVFQAASASHYLILRALEEAGLGIKDINIKSLSNVEARGAFLADKIGVWATGDPHYAIAEKFNKIRVIRDSVGIQSPGGYYVAYKPWAQENIGLLKHIVQEIENVDQWAERNRDEFIKIYAEAQKVDLDVAKRIVDRRTFGRRAISPDLIKEQQRVADYFFKNGVIPKQVNVSEALLTPEQYAEITPANISQK